MDITETLRSSLPILDTLSSKIHESPTKTERSKKKKPKHVAPAPISANELNEKMKSLIAEDQSKEMRLAERIRNLNRAKQPKKQKKTNQISTDDLANLVSATLAKLAKHSEKQNQIVNIERSLDIWNEYQTSSKKKKKKKKKDRSIRESLKRSIKKKKKKKKTKETKEKDEKSKQESKEDGLKPFDLHEVVNEAYNEISPEIEAIELSSPIQVKKKSALKPSRYNLPRTIVKSPGVLPPVRYIHPSRTRRVEKHAILDLEDDSLPSITPFCTPRNSLDIRNSFESPSPLASPRPDVACEVSEILGLFPVRQLSPIFPEAHGEMILPPLREITESIPRMTPTTPQFALPKRRKLRGVPTRSPSPSIPILNEGKHVLPPFRMPETLPSDSHENSNYSFPHALPTFHSPIEDIPSRESSPSVCSDVGLPLLITQHPLTIPSSINVFESPIVPIIPEVDGIDEFPKRAASPEIPEEPLRELPPIRDVTFSAEQAEVSVHRLLKEVLVSEFEIVEEFPPRADSPEIDEPAGDVIMNLREVAESIPPQQTSIHRMLKEVVIPAGDCLFKVDDRETTPPMPDHPNGPVLMPREVLPVTQARDCHTGDISQETFQEDIVSTREVSPLCLRSPSPERPCVSGPCISPELRGTADLSPPRSCESELSPRSIHIEKVKPRSFRPDLVRARNVQENIATELIHKGMENYSMKENAGEIASTLASRQQVLSPRDVNFEEFIEDELKKPIGLLISEMKSNLDKPLPKLDLPTLDLDVKINSICGFLSEEPADISTTLPDWKPSTRKNSERIADITKSLSGIMELNSYFSPKELSYEDTPQSDMGKLDHFMSKIEATVSNITRLETRIAQSPERSFEILPESSHELIPNTQGLEEVIQLFGNFPNLPEPLNMSASFEISRGSMVMSDDILSDLHQIDAEVEIPSPVDDLKFLTVQIPDKLPSPVDDLVDKIEAFSSDSSLANVEKVLAQASNLSVSDTTSDSSESYAQKVLLCFLHGRSMDIDWDLIPQRDTFIEIILQHDISRLLEETFYYFPMHDSKFQTLLFKAIDECAEDCLLFMLTTLQQSRTKTTLQDIISKTFDYALYTAFKPKNLEEVWKLTKTTHVVDEAIIRLIIEIPFEISSLQLSSLLLFGEFESFKHIIFQKKYSLTREDLATLRRLCGDFEYVLGPDGSVNCFSALLAIGFWDSLTLSGGYFHLSMNGSSGVRGKYNPSEALFERAMTEHRIYFESIIESFYAYHSLPVDVKVMGLIYSYLAVHFKLLF